VAVLAWWTNEQGLRRCQLLAVRTMAPERQMYTH